MGIRENTQFIELKITPYTTTLPDNSVQQSNIEMVAAKVLVMDQWVNIAVIYSPDQNVTENEFLHYFQQVPHPALILGDLNSRHKYFEPNINDQSVNQSGKALFSALLSSDNLSLISPRGLHTRFDPATGEGSVLDICFGDNRTFNNASFTLGQQMPSDHQPVIGIFNEIIQNDVIGKLPRWKLKGEAWKTFQENLPKSPTIPENNIDEATKSLTDIIRQAAEKAFTLSTTRGSQRSGLPWWSGECEAAVRRRRTAWNKWKRYPTIENLISYKKCEAISKRTIKKAKTEAWDNHCNQLSFNSRVGETWRFLKAMEGKASSRNIPLSKDGQPLTTNKDKANLLASHYHQTVGLQPDIMINIGHHPPSTLLPEFSSPFKMHELRNAIRDAKKGKAPGDDLIIYEFLDNLPDRLMEIMLDLFNDCWRQGVVPSPFKIATIIPLLKSGKDPTDPGSYRHITLISHVAKLQERLVERRLRWFLESQNLMRPELSGFRPRRSTLDCLAQMEHEVRETQKNKQVMLCLVIDLKSAFDTIPHQAVLNQLAASGIQGSPLKWFQSFLTDRKFKVSIGPEFSEELTMNRGLPQGSILSPILFNQILQTAPDIQPSNYIIYADDKFIISRAATLIEAEENLQSSIPALEEWMIENYLSAEITKCKVLCFTNKKLDRPPIITLNGIQVPNGTEHKHLGLYIDAPNLTWSTHIENLKVACMKRLDVLRKISGIKWGASRDTMLKYYIASIRSKILYGASIYSSGSNTVLKKLNVIQNTALRISLGAFKSSPVISLEAESGIPGLSYEITYETARHLQTLLRRDEAHPLLKMYEPYLQQDTLLWKTRRKPLLKRGLEAHTQLEIDLPQRQATATVSPLPPWIDIEKTIHTDFEDITNKSEQMHEIRPSFYNLVQEKYHDHHKIYTDGSHHQQSLRSAAAVYVETARPPTMTNWKLKQHTEITQAELFAIKKACEVTLQQKLTKTVIFSDSKSALHLLSSTKPASYVETVFETQSLIHHILLSSNSFHIQWIPSHSRIKGNDIADQGAKLGLVNVTTEDLPLALSTLKNITRKRVDASWANSTSQAIQTTGLGRIRSDVSTHPWTRSPKRRLDTAILRLRIGHCGFNHHLHRLNLEPSPNCQWCGQEDTIDHFFFSCPRHHSIRTELRAKLSSLHVTFTLKDLLGGGTYPDDTNFQILRLVKIFLKKSGRLDHI